MPRDSNGNYSLPAGNPVTTLSVISSTWANTTLSDLSTAMTGSLDRSGQGAMLAGLKLFDGVIGAPGLTWGTDTTSGLYHNTSGDFRFSVGGQDTFKFLTNGAVAYFSTGSDGSPALSWFAEQGSGMYRAGSNDYRWVLGASVELLQFTSNLLRLSGTAPAFRWNESDAAANNRLWDIIASGEDLVFRTLTDALVASSWMSVSRLAGVADAIIMHTPFRSQGLATFEALGAASPSVNISSARPMLRWTETGVTANNSVWQIDAEGEAFRFFTSDDAGGASVIWLQADRTGTAIDTVNFLNIGQLQSGGIEIGYKGFAQNAENNNWSITNGANNGITYYVGAGGHTGTVQASFTAVANGPVATIVNHGAGTITIATASGTLQWLNGSGAVSTGSRTLAIGGVCTITVRNSTGNPYIWGTGLT